MGQLDGNYPNLDLMWTSSFPCARARGAIDDASVVRIVAFATPPPRVGPGEKVPAELKFQRLIFQAVPSFLPKRNSGLRQDIFLYHNPGECSEGARV